MAWLILRSVRQRGLLPRLLRVALPAPGEAQPIAVIVPARDEAANIGPCLQALVAQDYPASRMHVLVIDDNSADETAAIVRRVAALNPHVSLIPAPPLPPRWVGKSHACWIGVRNVEPQCEWLCFIDADVTIAPAALSCAVQAALANRLDLLSLTPRQELKSFAERLILPCGLIVLSFLQDLRRLQSRSGSDATATGQFMLVRQEAYAAVGGHAAVCTAICEDLELARRIKRSGRAVLLMGGDDLLSTRMYTGWRTLWPGFAKNLVDTFGGPLPTLAVATAAFVLGWATVAIPVLDFADWMHGADGAGAALWLALAASGAAIGLHIAAALYFRIPFWYGLIFPLGYSVGALMALDSIGRRLSGRVSWKGRIYS
ncbi:MAG TPA: glycosyltransferase [Xanthobacteraceae bacterium]|nr:glycosyltransferase [Xanthobacteraceae bacterium]